MIKTFTYCIVSDHATIIMTNFTSFFTFEHNSANLFEINFVTVRFPVILIVFTNGQMVWIFGRPSH